MVRTEFFICTIFNWTAAEVDVTVYYCVNVVVNINGAVGRYWWATGSTSFLGRGGCFGDSLGGK